MHCVMAWQTNKMTPRVGGLFPKADSAQQLTSVLYPSRIVNSQFARDVTCGKTVVVAAELLAAYEVPKPRKG